jgi:hypothetical protein
VIQNAITRSVSFAALRVRRWGIAVGLDGVVFLFHAQEISASPLVGSLLRSTVWTSSFTYQLQTDRLSDHAYYRREGTDQINGYKCTGKADFECISLKAKS